MILLIRAGTLFGIVDAGKGGASKPREYGLSQFLQDNCVTHDTLDANSDCDVNPEEQSRELLQP